MAPPSHWEKMPHPVTQGTFPVTRYPPATGTAWSQGDSRRRKWETPMPKLISPLAIAEKMWDWVSGGANLPNKAQAD